ncbi:MAG: transcription-repair coupling factor [candidate division KSB1 bacterium]|nr:transcription-repair coupling factor [candidate division KSB1 bacterium]MDZ7301952.1 transcription-repair coupling factor [candidate division KSB1 bacterium]MDZ7312357.1 transcription-repair coupling factor [candidate division KSB1 bacterium]
MSLDAIKKHLEAAPFFREICCRAAGKNEVVIRNAPGSLPAVLAALLFEQTRRPVLCLFPFVEQAERFRDELDELLPEGRVTLFPPLKVLPWGQHEAHVTSMQLEIIERLLDANFPTNEGSSAPSDPFVIVTGVQALQIKLKSPGEMRLQKLHFQKNAELPFATVVEQLVTMDFERQPMVEMPGEMSVRGGIIDIYPFSRPLPVRIEFWGDTIESIREFDPATQRSQRELHEIAVWSQTIQPKGGSNEKNSVASLLDYLAHDTVTCFFQTEQMAVALTRMNHEPGIGNDEEWLPQEEVATIKDEALNEFLSRFQRFTRISFPAVPTAASKVVVDCGALPQPAFHGDLAALRRDMEKFVAPHEPATTGQSQLYFLCESPAHSERIKDLFDERNFDFPQLHIITAGLHGGFQLPQLGLAVYTDHEFYGRIRRVRPRRRFKEGLTFRQLKALMRGDYVVHVDHGIGIYQGLQKITTGGFERECLVIQYQDQDRLFVPLDRMDRVQKYSSRDGVVPRIHKLGAPDWDRLKKRTKNRIKDIARDLLKLYATRKARKGISFPPDTYWQKELEASFVYEDTPDQTRAVEEVKRDMESEQPMDRLVCGDVGYGKTEVAIRAAFKVVQNSKQVAVLVPTTILAQQHYNTFRERLSKYPVQIEMLSRFRSAAEQKQIVEKLKSGQVDVVIGTHRLLSKDVAFKDLGLLIVDEEHRFGVRHKEQLKQLRVNVDVLTLSATPIPRTLHMSLLGIRDMSNINTPPKDRLPVYTEMVQFDRELIRQVILREIHRGGQVFFVHNRVSSIYRMADLLRRVIPEVEIGVAHGQMKERQLEKTMLDFIERKFHVLVATMIIESGLDLPNVNTMIINRADRFGLAQLYQLRGRVGRSHHKAYCYLIIPPVHYLTPEAIKRLETIEQFTELGSGFQIAMRDLEIRGAGNMLGAEQSGFIDSLGFDLYCKILDEAVQEARMEALPQEAIPELGERREECRVEMDGDAYLPADYVEIPAERVAIYRRLAEAKKLSEIEAVREELADRFGRLPEAAENLLGLASLKILGTALGLRRLQIAPRQSMGIFGEYPHVFSNSSNGRPGQRGEPLKQWIGLMVQRAVMPFEFIQRPSLGFRLPVPKPHSALPVTLKFLQGWLTEEQR